MKNIKKHKSIIIGMSVCILITTTLIVIGATHTTRKLEKIKFWQEENSHDGWVYDVEGNGPSSMLSALMNVNDNYKIILGE